MKKIIVAAITLLITLCAFAQDGKSLYNKYSDQKDVSAVYISPAMFRLMGKLPDIQVNDEKDNTFNLGAFVQSLSGMYILNSENTSINAALKSEAEKMINKGKFELLMEAKDNGETVRMYTLGDEKTIESFVLLAVEPNETTFICLDGKMERAMVEKEIAKSMK